MSKGQRQREYGEVEARLTAATQPPLELRQIGQQVGSYALWEVQVPATESETCRVLLTAGVHGDEPAGVEALRHFLETQQYQAWPATTFTLLPCLNPWGYEHDVREGPAGKDLNRAYRRTPRSTPEVSAVKQALGTQRFALALDLHEDCDAAGFYAWEAPAPSAMGEAIIAAVGQVGPITPDGKIEGFAVRDGLMRAPGFLGRYLALVVRLMPIWTLGTYQWRHHAPQQCTFETPTGPPLAQRAAMHLAAIETAVRSVSRE